MYKEKIEKFKLPKNVKRIFPIFSWKMCICCNNQFIFERGWKLKSHVTSLNSNPIIVCSRCFRKDDEPHMLEWINVYHEDKIKEIGFNTNAFSPPERPLDLGNDLYAAFEYNKQREKYNRMQAINTFNSNRKLLNQILSFGDASTQIKPLVEIKILANSGFCLNFSRHPS